MWCERKSEIQDDASQTVNTYISACIQHSRTIPTTVPMLLGSTNSAQLFSLLCYASKSRKFKMAAHKHGILISQLVYRVAAQFQWPYPCFFRFKNSAELFFILCDASKSQWSKMAAPKLKNIYISACILNSGKTPTTIPSFWGTAIQWSYSSFCVMQTEGRNSRWRFTNRQYSSQPVY